MKTLRWLIGPVLAGAFFVSAFAPWAAAPAMAQQHCPRIIGNCTLTEEDDYFDDQGNYLGSDCYYTC